MSKSDMLYRVIQRLLAIFPIDKNLVLFESHDDFVDSSKIIFDRLKKEGHYRTAWIVHDYTRFKTNHPDIRCYPINIKERKIFQFILGSIIQARARTTFYTHRIIGNPFKKKQQRVFITHAAPPVKNSTGYFWSYKDNSSILSTSVFAARYRCKTLGGGIDRVVITGLPRNDLLFNTQAFGDVAQKIGINKKMILWMPTFKSHKNGKRNDYGAKNANDISLLTEKNLNKIQEALSRNDIMLVIKPHPAQDMSKIRVRESSNIRLITNDDLSRLGIAPYELLGLSDALITDFSSVYFDYLLCDKPIGFDLVDKNKYEKGVGFIFENPLEYMPGHKIGNIDEFVCFVDDVANSHDKYKKERRELLELSHKYKDGKSTERVLRAFGLINE